MGVVNKVIVAFFAVAVINLVSSYLQTYLVSWVGERVILDLRRQLFAHIQKLSLDFFSRQRTGWIVSRLTNDIDALSQLVTDGVVSLDHQLADPGRRRRVHASSSTGVWRWRRSPSCRGLAVATLVFRTHSARSYALVRNRVGDVSAHLQESIAGVRTLKTFRREKSDYDKLRDRQRRLPRGQLAHRGAERLLLPRRSSSSRPSAWSSCSGSAATWQAAERAAGRRARRLHRLPVELLRPAAAALAALQHLPVVDGRRAEDLTVLDTDPDLVDAPDAAPLRDVRGEVRFEGVSFSYDEGTEVLHDLGFTVPAGTTVALVGTTGAGKSTIVKLLARFYDPSAGVVRLDGHDLRTVTMKSLREQLAVVPQEAYLFSGPIIDNIRFGRPEAKLEEVQRVARIIGAHEFIEELPDGYETDVAEGGGALSTGQRQLVSFARALLADPRVLILDEATSSVDAASEREISRAMEVLFSGRTSVLVAHRLSTVRYADQILVVDAGRIVERGTHDELIARRGRYAQLYEEWEEKGLPV